MEQDDASKGGSSTATSTAVDLADELARASTELEGGDALDICRWAIGRFGSDLVVASSFQDCVLIDLSVKIDPNAEVVFIDTGFHFPETLSYVDTIVDRYGLNLTVLKPDIPLDVDPCGSPSCCERRKVDPLNRHLQGRAGWITGLKRVDTPDRANAPIASWDALREIVKINPLAAWTDDDVDAYVEANDLPRHPLNAKGYISIGCAPTTRPTAPGEDPRAGRWPESDKTECGLHI